VGRGEFVAALSRDWRGISLDTKLALCQHYNSILLGSHPAIESTSVRYGERIRSVWYVNSFGAAYREDRPRVVISYGATARRGDLVQQGFDSVASVSDYGIVEGREKEALAAAKMAVDLLDAPPVEGQTCDVILDPELGGVFAHEAFGHLSEADFLYENPKMCELMHLGRKVGVKDLTIVDDGSIPNSLGSQRFDDEGVPMQKTKLITNGVLTGHLHSLETAGTMGAAPTGNARAIGRRSSPIVRMTNTYIEAGTESFESLIAGIDHGLYCCRAFGGQTMMEQFTFSAGHARRIEHGKLGELVRDVVLTGNVFSTLEHMDGFGSDLVIEQNGGGCGKGGQSPLPVTDGAPHLRVRQVTVGGKAQ
jgi:TldD protein